jgi:hypothetical protein
MMQMLHVASWAMDQPLYTTGYFGAGPADYLLQVSCAGSESSLDLCPHRGWGVHSCREREVVCEGCGLNQFTCASGGGCVPLSSVCDDHPLTVGTTAMKLNVVVSLNVLLGTVCLLALSVMVLVTALIQLIQLSVCSSIQFVWWVGVVLMKVVLRSTTRDSGALSVMMDGAGQMLMWCVGSLAMIEPFQHRMGLDRNHFQERFG